MDIAKEFCLYEDFVESYLSITEDSFRLILQNILLCNFLPQVYLLNNDIYDLSTFAEIIDKQISIIFLVLRTYTDTEFPCDIKVHFDS